MDAVGLRPLIVSVILERPTCLPCIAAKVNADTLAVRGAIRAIAETRVQIDIDLDERCRACGGTDGPVYSLKRPK